MKCVTKLKILVKVLLYVKLTNLERIFFHVYWGITHK